MDGLLVMSCTWPLMYIVPVIVHLQSSNRIHSRVKFCVCGLVASKSGFTHSEK